MRMVSKIMTKENADALLLESELHDEKWRRTHKKPKDTITFSNGRWECEEMRKSRVKNVGIETKEYLREELKSLM